MLQRFCISIVAIASQLVFLLCLASSTAASSPLSVNPTSIQFGSVSVGGSAQHQITITNTNAFEVVLSSVVVSGRYFYIGGISAPLSLRPKASATFVVTFAPQIAGTQNGLITISGRGLPAVTNISLSAAGIPGQVLVVPSSASFGSVPVGSSNSQTFTITNHHAVTVTVSSDTIGGSGFTVTNLAKGETIAPARSATFTVTFKPTASGTTTTSESISFSSPGSSATTITIPLSGKGVASTTVLQASPSTLNFGNVNVGSSNSLQLKLTNAGNSKFTFTQSSLTGTGFSAAGQLTGLTLLPGQSEEVEIVFKPQAKGSAFGTMSISAGTTGASVSVSGSGIQGSAHSVNLSWTPSVSQNVTGYAVERGNSASGPFQQLNSVAIGATDYVDSTVTDGETYFYEIRSVASSGAESQPTSPVSVTIPSS